MSLNSFTHNFYHPPAISARTQTKTFHLILQTLQVRLSSAALGKPASSA